MALIDDIIIKVKAGDGGNGGRSFKTNYGSIKSWPDGGNGGRGGSIFFCGTSNLNDLSEFRYKKVITADDGARGMNNNLDGRASRDITVLVPLGTTIIDTKTNEATEIVEEDKPVLMVKGGRGGTGNHDQKIVIGQVTKMMNEGEKGEEKELHLILNLIADVGLIGLPNAGKSSLLSVLTRATPKIGNYPFTTLEPSLGTMGKIVIADIPGLIDGAAAGRGLGIEFLKHIQKTKILLHCIDVTSDDVFKDYQTVRREFEEYDKKLLSKKELILLTKIDLAENIQIEKAKKTLAKTKKEIYTISIYDEDSVDKVKDILPKKVN